jgi:hypothetical protein
MDLNSDKYWKRLNWNENNPDRTKFNNVCHWGQLKLFYTEIEFITLCIERGYNLDNCTMLYIGAAPGTHIKYLHKLFPTLHWILIDPNHFNIHENDYIDIFTKKDGFFTDDMIPLIKSHHFIKRYPNLLFISDIRTNTQETTIFKEMLDQQRWLLKLRADMSMLKFRLPYTIKDGNSNWKYSLQDIKPYIKTNIKYKTGAYNLYYLYGDIYVQLFPPKFSTETRLIIDRKRDGYKMYNYNTVVYEEKCFHYNTNIRIVPCHYKQAENLKYHILGATNNYETCSEYYIVEQYLLATNNIATFDNVCKLLYEIRHFHTLIISSINEIKFNKSLATCAMSTIIIERFPNYNNFVVYMTKAADNNITSKEIINNITTLYNTITKKNEQYLTWFNQGKLLSKYQYTDQINLIHNANKINKAVINTITNYYNTYTAK